MKISKLKKMIEKAFGPYFHISNLYLDNQKHICLAVYGSKELSFRSYYAGHLELDRKGSVIKVHGELAEKIKSLKTAKIDLTSYAYNYERIIYSRPRGVEDAEILGIVKENGQVLIYSKDNFSKIEFDSYYHGNQKRKEAYKNLEAAEVFKSTWLKEKLTRATISDRGIRYYQVSFNKRGFVIQLTLSQFFDYAVTARIFKNDNLAIELRGSEEVKNLKSYLKELEFPKKMSLMTKSKIICQTSGVQSATFSELPGEQRILGELHFKGDHVPRGCYRFVIDFKKAVIFCKDSKSKTFVPALLERLNKKIRNFSLGA